LRSEQDQTNVGVVDSLEVTMHVNGSHRILRLEPRVTLLDALREYAGLTGTKKGCDHGKCGACHMLPRGKGKTINIGSVMCFEAGLNIPAYPAANHASAGLSRALAVGWSGRGININCFAPSYFDTNMATSLKSHRCAGRRSWNESRQGAGADRRSWRGCACSWPPPPGGTCTAASCHQPHLAGPPLLV